MSDLDYTEARCPMPGCDEVLHIAWTSTRPVFLHDLFDGADLPAPDDAYTATWQVGCLNGHVILLPDLEGLRCQCGDEECNGADAGVGHDDFDGEDLRTFREVDVARLRDLLAARTVTT